VQHIAESCSLHYLGKRAMRPPVTRAERELQLQGWIRTDAGRERLRDLFMEVWDLDDAVDIPDNAGCSHMIQAILASEFPYWENG
jgi:hypothetical protein